jgi:chromosome segregation ATPase
MNNRIGVIVLLVICLGLGVAVIVVKKKASDEHLQDSKQIHSVSNQWVQASTDLEEQKKVATMLEKDLETKKQDFEKSLGELTNNLTQVSSNLAKTETSLRTAEQDLKERDAKIADLEAQNQALDKKAEALSNSITNLNTQIADTRHKLAASEGDKAFLEQRLKQLVAEKTELERQFYDLGILRAQVAKLKEEQNVARRMEWARQGLFANSEEKGAQRLMQGLSAPQKGPRPSYDLNVEVNADGSVRVVPPSTNQVAPAKTPR